ncbi:MAG: YihY/virulence factor BrkB family protein [Kiritimatiellae bacterium]|nr:YihY/virulence factor BrkB family protein [Kiritimatiellia bacterium]
MKQKRSESILKRVLEFLQRGMWQMSLHNKSWIARSLVKLLQVLTLVTDGFRRNQCALHASSLTLFSLISIVPVLVLMLALARTLGNADVIRAQIDSRIDLLVHGLEQSAVKEVAAHEQVPAQEQKQAPAESVVQPEFVSAFTHQFREVVDQIFEQVNTIDFGKLGGIGGILLIWSVIGVLGKVEGSFNQIWGVKKSRTFVRKFADYLCAIVILPCLLAAVSTVPVVQMVSSVTQNLLGKSASSNLSLFLDSQFLKIVISSVGGTLAFSFLLGFMPNARVKMLPALLGGLVTLILFGIWLKLCTMLQVGIARYSALYGGFAVLPILLLWVNTSWQIILLGSEISFALQNRDTYMLELFADEASMRARLLMAITLCAESVRASQQKGGGAFDAERYAHDNGVPHRFVTQILGELVEHHIIAEVADQPGKFLLCRCSSKLSAGEVVDAMMNHGESIQTLGLGELSCSVAALEERWQAAEQPVLEIPLAQLCVAET